MPKPKILFVTKRLDSRPSDEAIHNELLERFSEAAEKAVPEKFPQPDYCPIQIPNEFRGDQLLSDTYRLACHETGHAVAGLFWCGWIDAVVLTSNVESGGIGRCFGRGGTGEDSARCKLAGLAAERLVQGYPLEISGFEADIANARNDLRVAKVPEEQLDERAQELYFEIQRTFAKNFTNAITAAATALTKRGILDGATLLQIISDAQETADASTLRKAFSNVQIGNGTGPCHLDVVKFPLKNFYALAKSLKLSQQAERLNKSLTDPTLSAIEVVQRSVDASNIERRASLLGDA